MRQQWQMIIARYVPIRQRYINRLHISFGVRRTCLPAAAIIATARSTSGYVFETLLQQLRFNRCITAAVDRPGGRAVPAG